MFSTLKRSLMLFGIAISLHVDAEDIYVPEALKPWVDWVLHDQEQIDCPFESQQGSRLNCLWISELQVNVNRAESTGASFEILVTAFAQSELQLPSTPNQRAHSVNINGFPAVLGGGTGNPRVNISVGTHKITGKLSWEAQNEPEYLIIPHSAIVRLSIDTKDLAHPFIDNDHRRLWLTRVAQSPEESTAEESGPNTLNIRVFRLLMDDLPQYLDTFLELTVGGQPRVIEIGKVLPDNFALIRVLSRSPAVVDSNGVLSIQVSRGENRVSLSARATEGVDTYRYQKINEHWPAEEIWGLRPNRNLRVVQVEGAPRVNLDQVQAPPQLTQTSDEVLGYVLAQDSDLNLVEEQRGNVNPNPAKFYVGRDLWLNFDGSSYVIRDQIQIETDSELRISANYVPGKVQVDGQLRLVSFGEPENESQPGVNIDNRRSTVVSVSKVDRTSSFPANGWQVDAHSLGIALHLPPGWRLLWLHGVDLTNESWLASWSIWDVFLCLLLVALVFKLANPWWAIVAAIAAVLTYQDSALPVIGWLVLAGVSFMIGLINAKWFRPIGTVVFWVLAVAVAAATLFHAAVSARQAFFPQLDPSMTVSQQAGVYGGDSQSFRGNMSTAPQEDEMKLDSVTVTGSRMGQQRSESSLAVVEESLEERATQDLYLGRQQDREDSIGAAAGVTIQTGPGTPTWSWRTAWLQWTGPVSQEHSISVVLLPPWATRAVAATSALLSIVVLALLVLLRSTRVLSSLPKVLHRLIPVLLLLVLIPTIDTYATTTPDPDLLRELRNRLTASPDCLPDCALVESAHIRVSEQSLVLTLKIHAEDSIAVLMPSGNATWQPTQISENGDEVLVTRGDRDRIHVLLDSGLHTIELSADLTNRSRFDIQFPLRPSVLTIDAPNWLVEGLVKGEMRSSQLSFARELQDEPVKDEETSTVALNAPVSVIPYVSVHRTLNLDFEPRVSTTVTRIAPLQEAFSVQIPLLQNETVLQSGVEVLDNSVTVSFAPHESVKGWSSRYEVEGLIELDAPHIRERHERWSIRGSDFWSFTFEGFTPVKSRLDETMFYPRSNEKLAVYPVRPKPVSGNTATIESVQLHYAVGTRSYESRMVLEIFASQATDFELTLPQQAVIQAIAVDRQGQPIPASSEILLPVQTGTHIYEVDWLNEANASTLFSTPSIQLQQGARNIDVSMTYPQGRWILYLGGPTLGAAVLYWAVVFVVLLVAVGISRLPNMPMTTTDAVLLSLGATLANLWGLLFAGVWFLMIWVRARKTEIDQTQFFYYLKQVTFILLSIVSFVVLVLSIPAALLGRPNMHIAGYESTPFLFRWFADESGTLLPSVWVLSLPRWVLFAAMLGWSLWLAFAILRWSRSAWEAVAQPEFWPQSKFARSRRKRIRPNRKPVETPVEQDS